jgi:hypothetical protein
MFVKSKIPREVQNTNSFRKTESIQETDNETNSGPDEYEMEMENTRNNLERNVLFDKKLFKI